MQILKEKIIDYAKRIDQLSLEANGYVTLGKILWRQGKYEKAIEIYERSLAIKSALSNQSGIAATLMNMGTAYQHLKQKERYQVVKIYILIILSEFNRTV